MACWALRKLRLPSLPGWKRGDQAAADRSPLWQGVAALRVPCAEAVALAWQAGGLLASSLPHLPLVLFPVTLQLRVIRCKIKWH